MRAGDLRDHGLDAAIRGRSVATGRPVFGVCVGMQVLFEGSDEDPEDRASAVLPGPRRDGSRTT